MSRLLSIEEAVSKMLEAQFGEYLELHGALEKCAMLVEKTAKEEFGVYQPDVGPFLAWPELAESTQADRLAKGYSPDEPLLRTGALRDSIEHETDQLETVIGSNSDVMVYQEFGTEKIPPRPVLGPALVRNLGKINKILGKAAVRGMMPAGEIPPGLGYDADL